MRKLGRRAGAWVLASGAVVAALSVVVACVPVVPGPAVVPTGIVGTTPADGGRMIPTSAPIAIAFSAPVNTASVSVSTTPAVALGSPTWILGNTAVSFTPSSPLPANTAMTLTVTGNDAAGAAISATPVQFTTAPATATLSSAHPRLMLTGATRTRLANALTAGDPKATRYKDVIDDHLFNGANLISAYEVWWGGLLGVLTNDSRYCTDSVQRIDQYVAAAEADIAANRDPDIAGDSYLHVGDELGDLALIWDWCPTFRTPSMSTRWSAFAQQTLYNVWNHNQAAWGGRSAPWTGWGSDNPRNNYFLSFVEATLLWGAAANGEHPQAAGWLATARQKIEHDLTIIHTTETPGGGSLEGTGYGSAIKRLLFLEYVWEASTGQRWADLTSSSEGWIRYLTAAIVPTNERFAPIGDQSRIVEASFTDYQREALLALAELHRATPWGRRARITADTSLPQMERPEEWVYDFLYGAADAGTAATMPLAYHAAGTGHVFVRSGTSTDATWLGFLSGPYVESHAHHDALSILLYQNDWRVDDAGLHSNSGLIQAEEAHGLVMFENGSTPIRMTNGGKADLYAFRPYSDYTYLGGSIGSLYPGESIGQDREIVFLSPGVAIVMDRIDTGARSLTRRFQLPMPVQPTVDPGNKVMHTGSGTNSLTVQRAYPDVATVSVQPYTALAGHIPGFDSDFTDGYRASTTVTASGKTQFLHVLSVGNTVTNVQYLDDPTQRGVRVTMTDGRTATAFFPVDRGTGSLEIRNASNAVLRQTQLLNGVERPLY